jgi:cell division protein FtsL
MFSFSDIIRSEIGQTKQVNLKLQKKAFKEFYAITQVIILLMFCRFLDESLRWLVANGKHKEIENQIRKAAKINNTDYNTVVENIQVSKEINVWVFI